MDRETSDDISKSTGYCHHGNTPNSCEYCLKEQSNDQAVSSEKNDAGEISYNEEAEEVKQNASERPLEEITDNSEITAKKKWRRKQ